jgi:ATP-dependent helicase/nuclease subunit A
MSVAITDQAARSRALDPAHSFIVQAPAGSGKTSLLTGRLLALLAQVEEPEHIIAITFTRKAANEMRTRVLEALSEAQGPAPESAHAKLQWQLAQHVLKHEAEQGWHLLQNPNRLRIFTIDALCASLARQMPLLSGLGTPSAIHPHPALLYQAAVKELLENLDEPTPWQQPLQTLLAHLDNNMQLLQPLLVAMLAKRDLWLPTVMRATSMGDLREHIEHTLRTIIETNLSAINDEIPAEEAQELCQLAAFAANTLDNAKSNSPITLCCDLHALPRPVVSELPRWLALTELLLTKSEGEFRKQVNKTLGFPAPSDFKNKDEKEYYQQHKVRMTALLGRLRERPHLQQLFADLQQAPPAQYLDLQWTILEALLTVLPILAAQCKLIFQREQAIDFIEMAQTAERALGAMDDPSQLALRLDYQIRHLLVDEFQDTSISQFYLLENLTKGWQRGDGRTLFLVGDPMQSIYRFRQAEVGLFLRAIQHGIGEIELEFLQLQANFRSQQGIIAWLNQHMPAAFPHIADIPLGAVPYSPSTATHELLPGEAVSVHPSQNEITEAEHICELIREYHAKDPSQDVAILVRSRSHLAFIIPHLKQHQIPFNAIELEPLAEHMIIQDLWSLTKALLHPFDRLAWFSILRAPWCGLKLDDLLTLAEATETISIPELLDKWQTLTFTPDAQVRLSRIVPVLQASNTYRERTHLADWVKKTWIALGGPAAVQSQHELEDATAFFDLLNAHTRLDLEDYSAFEERLLSLYAKPKPEALSHVHIMTIHKAKGLEFSVVILPGLANRSAANRSPLLRWAELPDPTGEPRLLLAPIKAVADEQEPLYHYLSRIENRKEHYEKVRLLYVAATRAKHRLHLFATLHYHPEKKAWQAPVSNSLLAPIWESVSVTVQDTLEKSSEQDMTTGRSPALSRLTTDWQAPPCAQLEPLQGHNDPTDIPWQTEPPIAAAVGTLIHRLLQHMSEQNIQTLDKHYFDERAQNWNQRLLELGVPLAECEASRAVVCKALSQTLNDTNGRWILDNRHRDSACELALSQQIDNELQTLIIDRTFIAEGYRWIIDYKTASPDQLPLDQFLDQQKHKHAAQLENYAAWFAKMEQMPVKLALYFPLVPAWVCWDLQNDD